MPNPALALTLRVSGRGTIKGIVTVNQKVVRPHHLVRPFPDKDKKPFTFLNHFIHLLKTLQPPGLTACGLGVELAVFIAQIVTKIILMNNHHVVLSLTPVNQRLITLTQSGPQLFLREVTFNQGRAADLSS